MQFPSKLASLALLAGALLATADARAGHDVAEFEDAALITVLNATDNDVQIFVRAGSEEGIRRIQIIGPQYKVRLSASFRDSGVGQADIAFDTTEPSLEELMEAYPPGNYHFFGRLVDGTRLRSTVSLSYDLAPAAEIVFPSEGDVGVTTDDLTVLWLPPAEAEAIRLAIENEETGESLEIDLPGDAASFEVPDGFLEAGTEYVLDIIVIAENGNQTVADVLFETAE